MKQKTWVKVFQQSKGHMAQEELPSLLTIAELALDFGFVPIPIIGKRPILPKWQQTTKQTALRKIQHAIEANQCDNIGVLTGQPSNMVVVDIDLAKGGLYFWEELIAKQELPVTFTVETGSGGRHYYWAYDKRTATLRNATRAIKDRGIDLKTTGGQVVWIGSIHPETGRMYDVIDGTTKEGEIIIASMPDWLFDLLQENQRELDKRYPRKYGDK